MSKLLRANFMRLGKSNSFSLCIIIQIFFAVLVFFMAYVINFEKSKSLVFDRSFRVGSGSYIMIFLSIFITSFISDDYSCQTIRNKLIVGYSRDEIYLSNLITVWISSLVIMAAYLMTVAVLSVFFGVEAGMPSNELYFLILTQIAAVTALASLYVLLSELVTRNYVAVAAALILSLFFTVMVAMNMESGMSPAISLSHSGISVFFNDIMPSGQLVQMEQMESVADIQRIFPVYSLAVTVFSSAIGILIFRKKDLK